MSTRLTSTAAAGGNHHFRFHLPHRHLAPVFGRLACAQGGSIRPLFRHAHLSGFADIDRCYLDPSKRGEKIVGAALEELQCDGYVAVHSLRLNKCDIDHVLVGPAGVFEIETKHGRGAGLITFRNGQGIFVGERRRWNGAINQAKAEAR